MRIHRAVFTGAVATLACLATIPAEAAGFSVARFGGEHGHPTTTNPTAIYYNPAGIAFSEGIHLFGDVSLAWRSTSYERPASDTTEPAGAEGANSGKNTLFNVLASPMLGATGKFGDFAVGAAFFTPFGGSGYWDKNDEFKDSRFAGPVDGVQRWYAMDGSLISSFLSLAAGYQVGPVGFGVAGNLILSSVDTVRARTGDATDNIGGEGRTWVKASGMQWSFGAGLMVEAIPEKLWLGASYQSQANPNSSDGFLLEGTLTSTRGLPNGDIDFHTTLPDVIRLGGTFRLSDTIEARLFGDYTRWSVMERQCLTVRGQPCDVLADGTEADSGNPPGSGIGVYQNQPRNWNDTFGVRAGASYFMSDTLELFGGAGYASNAVPDSTMEPSLADWDTISASAGARFGLTDGFHLAGSYTQVFYLGREVTNSTLSSAYQAGTRNPTHNPSANGKYSQMIGVLNINAEFEF